MDREKFWKIIDEARENADEIDDVPAAVTQSLEQLPPPEIVSFKQHQSDLLNEAYRWDLWAVAYIINGGCSDDGFEYFRAWLMANGSDRWKEAMENPEAAGDWAESDEADCEDMLYVAIDAYKKVSGGEFPYGELKSKRPEEPAGTAWEEDELPELYPELDEKFS
jgi:Protein of unknown function (DUF4240)